MPAGNILDSRLDDSLVVVLGGQLLDCSGCGKGEVAAVDSTRWEKAMEELHELLGNMALTAGMLTVSFGIVIYRYAWFKGLLGARRNLFLSWHLIGAGLCVAFLFDH